MFHPFSLLSFEGVKSKKTTFALSCICFISVGNCRYSGIMAMWYNQEENTKVYHDKYYPSLDDQIKVVRCTTSSPSLFFPYKTKQDKTTQDKNNTTQHKHKNKNKSRQHNTTQHTTIQYNTTQRKTTQHNTTLHCTTHNTTLFFVLSFHGFFIDFLCVFSFLLFPSIHPSDNLPTTVCSYPMRLILQARNQTKRRQRRTSYFHLKFSSDHISSRL